MKENVKIICIIIIFILLWFIIIFFNYNNLVFLSSKDEKELMELLQIEEAESFTPIRMKRCSTGFHGSDPDYYEVKFEISTQDYEKNHLNYQETSYYEVLIDCQHKEKKDENTYTCILRVSEMNNKELFNKLSES